MAVQYAFGQIVTNGLVLALDAADRNSYVSGSTTWFDLSGYNSNGTLTNGPTFNSSNNGSIVFDGTNDYVGVPYNANLAPTAAISFGCIAYLSNWNVATNMRLLSKTQSGGYQIGMNEGVNYTTFLGGLVYAGGAYRTTKYSLASIASGWHVIMYTFDGQYFKMYLDGVNVDTLNIGSVVTMSYSVNNSLIIGAEAGSAATPDPGSYYNGRISSVNIYNTALSAAEVSQNYNAVKSRFGL